jgi:hypothetical protein
VEEATGLARALAASGKGTARAVPAESLAALERDLAPVRGRVVTRVLVRADSLRKAGRALAAVDEAARVLRLAPEDMRAKALWDSLEATLGKTIVVARTLTHQLDALTARSIDRALAADPKSEEAKAWRERIARRLAAPKPELDARIKQLYIKGMEAFTAGDYRAALHEWEQILVLDPLNESARRNVLEARERMKTEARR